MRVSILKFRPFEVGREGAGKATTILRVYLNAGVETCAEQ